MAIYYIILLLSKKIVNTMLNNCYRILFFVHNYYTVKAYK